MREIVNARIARGRVVVNILPQPRPSSNANVPAIDRAAARAYYQAMVALKEELGAGGEIGIETILRAPGVLRAGDEPLDPEQTWPSVEAALADRRSES